MRKIKAIIGILAVSTCIMGFTVPGEWVPFEAAGCKVEFPAKPDAQTKTINSAVGELTMNIFMYDASKAGKDDNYIYMLVTTDYPDSLINSDYKEKRTGFFRNAIDGAVKNVNGKLLSEVNMEIDGFPGREIKIDFKEGMAVIKARFYLVKNRLYMIQTITQTGKYSNASIDRFMGSFKLAK